MERNTSMGWPLTIPLRRSPPDLVYTPIDVTSGQDCDGAYGQAPMRSLLTWSVGGLGRLENEVDRSPERHCAGPITGQTRAEEARVRLSQSHFR